MHLLSAGICLPQNVWHIQIPPRAVNPPPRNVPVDLLASGSLDYHHLLVGMKYDAAHVLAVISVFKNTFI